MLRYLRTCNHFLLVAQKILKQREFFLCEGDCCFCTCNFALKQVNGKVIKLQLWRASSGASSDQRADAGEEFIECERLGEVIISAEVKPFYLILSLAK